MHGANRLGGNSLSDLIVFGWLAGKGAKEYIDALSDTPQLNAEEVDAARKRATAPLNREDGENPYLLHDDLQKIMHDNVNIVREGGNLQKGIEMIEALKKKVANVKAHGSSQFNPGWHEALSMESLVTTAEMVARAAEIRKESRGAHTRLDFEGEDKEWEKYELVIFKGENGMVVDKRERKAAPPELAAIARATLEELEGKNV